MKVRNPREKSLGLAVMFGLSHLLLAGHGTLAQEAADEAAIEEIFVVGSRIAAYEDDAALPVSVTDADDIARSGAPTVAEVIARTPFNSQGPSITMSGSAGSTVQGSSDVNLRGLGFGRTLSLLNGRRLPPDGAGFAFSTNLNFIPTAAVERVEILRDGGSPVYGSDALGGVVNLVLKDDYHGGNVTVQYGGPSGLDMEERIVNATFGLTDDRSSVLVSAELRKIDSLRVDEIAGLRADVASLGNGFTSDGYPPTFTIQDIFGDGTGVSSVMLAAPNCSSTLIRTSAGATLTNPDTGATITYDDATECRQEIVTGTDFTAQSELRSIFLTANYDVTDELKIFLDVLTADFDTDGVLAPLVSRGLTMAADSPNNPTLAATPANPVFGVTGPRALSFNLSAPEFFTNQIRTEQNLIAIGADWETDQGTLSAYFHYAESITEQSSIRSFRTAGVQAAIDSGALNPFGDAASGAGSFGGASGVFVRKPTGEVETIHINWASELPVWEMPEGPISYSFGYEQREESYVESGDGSGFAQGYNKGFALPANNVRNVDSLFVESLFPIHESFEIGVAARWDSYDLPDFSKTSPRLTARWRATPSLTFRGSFTQGIAAPNLFFVGSGSSQLVSSVVDTRQCQEAGNDPTDPRCQPVAVNQTIQGGPDLSPETSDNLNIGVVWTPLDSLTLSLDYWSIELDDQVANLASQTVVDLEAADANLADFGVSLERDSNGDIVSLTSGAANIPGFETDGFDIQANYGDSLSWGDFSSDLILTWVNSFKRPIGPGEPVLDAVGFQGVPEFKANWNNTLQFGDFVAGVFVSYVDSFDGRTPEAAFSGVQPIGNIGSFVTVDASLTWSTRWESDVYLGFRNVFDEQPTFDRGIYPSGFDTGNSNILGRVLTLRYSQDF